VWTSQYAKCLLPPPPPLPPFPGNNQSAEGDSAEQTGAGYSEPLANPGDLWWVWKTQRVRPTKTSFEAAMGSEPRNISSAGHGDMMAAAPQGRIYVPTHDFSISDDGRVERHGQMPGNGRVFLHALRTGLVIIDASKRGTCAGFVVVAQPVLSMSGTKGWCRTALVTARRSNRSPTPRPRWQCRISSLRPISGKSDRPTGLSLPTVVTSFTSSPCPPRTRPRKHLQSAHP
jgi:hypothetical protein